MATYTKKLLSGSTNGKGIKVTKTETLGDTIHTAIAGTSSLDEIWLYAYNGHTANVILTLEFGGVAVPDNNIVVTIPYKGGLIPIIPGLLLQNELVVSAFASVANVITLSGFVNRIS